MWTCLNLIKCDDKCLGLQRELEQCFKHFYCWLATLNIFPAKFFTQQSARRSLQRQNASWWKLCCLSQGTSAIESGMKMIFNRSLFATCYWSHSATRFDCRWRSIADGRKLPMQIEALIVLWLNLLLGFSIITLWHLMQFAFCKKPESWWKQFRF